MDLQGRDLKLRMKGADVLQLQTDLRALGATITDPDSAFGQSTRQAVIGFQSVHGLPSTGVVDAQVRQQINATIASSAATPSPIDQPPPGAPEPIPVPQSPDDSRRLIVEGEVVQPDGSPLRAYRVRAFDRALCDWRPLGNPQTNFEVRTNDAGRYTVTYDPAQLKAWGKTLADLKVEVYEPSGDVKLAESPLILQALPNEIVNFAIGDQPYRGRDEYTRVEATLAQQEGFLDHLDCLEVPDVLILARDARLESSKVAYYVKARRWAAELDAPAALFYGLLRRNQPTRLDALLARPLARLWAALEQAKDQNIINLPLDTALRGRLSDVQQRFLTQPEHPQTKLLNTTALTAAQQAAFTQRLITTELAGDAFWQSLESDDGFGTAQVTDVREAFALQTFTDDNTSLTIHLRSAMKVRASREVAGFSMESWRDTILTGAGVEIPDEIRPGEAEPARRAAYAQLLYRSAELRYPTASLAGQMKRSAAWAQQPVSGFLAAFPDFEFGDERVTYFLRDHPEAGDFGQASAELLRVEQLFHLTPPEDKLAVIQPLWNAGLRSAPQIASLGRQHLLRIPGALDRHVTTGIYRQAVHITSMALHVYLRYHPQLNSLSPSVVRAPQLPRAQPVAGAATARRAQLPRARALASAGTVSTSQPRREQALASAATTLPEWEALFGSTDACECSHCESALSPAAYLVDTMALLQRAVAVDDSARNALDELLDRRPDLGTLQLTCENTETELPQIDLLCEILESIAVSVDHKTLSGDAIGSTTWDSAQLAAEPEHFDPAAYELLRAATYPFVRLPFDLRLAEGRRYLDQMGIARDELMRVMPPRPGVDALAIATEALQLSAFEAGIIRLPNTRLDDVAAGWGVDLADGTLRTLLGHVEPLTRQAAIDYATLLRLLNTQYVNADRMVAVTFAGDPCALDGAELTRADGSELTAEEFRSFLDRLHRFLRLQRRLAWTEYELDSALPALGVEDFNAKGFLPDLAAVQSLRETFDLSPGELCSWWSDLSTQVFEEDVPSQYEAIFLNPSMFPDTHIGGGPDLLNDVFALTNDRADLAITTSTDAALSRWLAESNAATPPTYTVQPDYSAYIQSVTRLTAEDLLLLVAEVLPKDAATGDVALNLANVSLLYRIASFVRAIRSSAGDYLTLQRITRMSPLRTPTATAGPLDTSSFHTIFGDIDEGNWSIEQLAYLLLHDADAAAVLSPTPEDMDAWLTATSPGFAGVRGMRPANVSPDLKAAVTQSLGSTSGVDAAVLDALLFLHRPALGDSLLAHLIIDANPGAANLPTPARDFHTVFETVHKFGVVWKGLGLDTSHLAFVLDRGPAAGWTDIAALPVEERTATNFEAWRRLTAAADLQAATFTVEQSLFGVLQAAIDGTSNPATFVLDGFLAQISASSGWSLADVTYLTGPGGFNFAVPAAMQDERPFVALRQAFDLFRRSGVSAEQVHAWTVAELTFAETQSIKQALTLSYSPEQWLNVLAPIQDELRVLRRDALLAYLLHALEFEDSTAFYHRYLIDPEHAACARTSRIVEAHAAVQIFAQRILFNLEPFEFSSVDSEAWQWRKNYRVWEAARKIFCYPENWIEPEWRTDKSAFFMELEERLSQDDITLAAAGRLYQEYLYKLDQVSRLEIMGMYEDAWVSGDIETKALHVFGRTRDLPHLYYYRRWEDEARWTPWEPVPLDIQSDHVTPIVYNGRLYLFWPTFTLTPIEADTAKLDEEIAELTKTIQEYNDTITVYQEQIDAAPETVVAQTLEATVALFEVLKDTADGQRGEKREARATLIADTKANEVEVSMAWSMYGDGRWSPKRLSTGGSNPIATDFRPRDFYFTGWISSDNRLYLAIRGERVVEIEIDPSEIEGPFVSTDEFFPPATTVETLDVGYFYFDDCQSALVFVAETNLSLTTASPDSFDPFIASSRGSSGSRAFAPVFSVIAPDGEVQVVDSIQSFDSRKLTGDELSLEIGGGTAPETRLLLASAGAANAKVRYAHQYGRGGAEMSPFFYVDDERSYFVQPVPDAPLPLILDLGAERQGAAAGARIAGSVPATPSQTSTHYQQSSTNQIIDHGVLGQASTGLDHLGEMGVILADDPSPTLEASSSNAALTGFRYVFSRFYHPFTCPFLTQLSRYGVEGVLKPDPDWSDASKDLFRQLTPLETFDFASTYTPASQWVFANNAAEELDERIDFNHDSPYGSYNWELFFHIPLLVATRLMQNQRFDEARRWFHCVFDPTQTGGDGAARFWMIKPFYQAQLMGPTETLQELIDLLEQGNVAFEQQVRDWESDPFDAHAIARVRITAYMQTTVRKYLDCLIQQADMLFTRDTREDINAAAQLYLLAAEILGERPTLLPAQDALPKTPNLLLERYRIFLGPLFSDDLLEGIASGLMTSLSGVASGRAGFRTASGGVTGQTIETSGTLTTGSGGATTVSAQGGTDNFNTLTLFCIPHNDLLYSYWDTVADRMFKIRHCMNLSGQVRQLALFAPPIDPALLVRAFAAGLDIQSIINSLFESLPNYRFSFMLQKAIELCGEVRNFGGALLAALEKQDAEQLAQLRSTHEVSLLKAVRALKQKTLEEADSSLAALLKSKEIAVFRTAYYSSLERVSSGEQESLDGLEESRTFQTTAEASEHEASVHSIIPNVSVAPMSVSVSFGGSNLGAADQATASRFRAFANSKAYEATKSGTMAGYDRRFKDWKFQADLGKKEAEQFDKQIVATEIRKQIAELDLANCDKQIEQAAEVDEFLKLKFTNQQLHSWMASKLSSLFFQIYQIAYQVAKQAERAYLHELGPQEAADTFVALTNWDSLKKGLLSGEQLHLDLRRMEKAYLDANRRELEITKPVSLFQIDPAALLELRQTGACDIHVSEVMFDLDFAGHYFRRIKAVRITIPGVAGPYTNVSATLSLTHSWTRRTIPVDATVAPESDVTVLPQTAIATCTGISDGGVFELGFNDQRYLPFEGAGAISTWHLELPTALRPFDYSTMADVVMHISYTARDGGDALRSMVNTNLIAALNDWKKLASSGDSVTPSRLFSLRHDFPNEWNRLTSPADGQAQVTLSLGKQHFPRYLDFLWSGSNGKLEPQPISLSFGGTPAEMILDPIGLPPLDADTPAIALSGLTEISNDAGAEAVITVRDGPLDAGLWRDLYLLLHYEVVA